MEAAIFDDLTLLADGVRSRMVAVLERHELTVTRAVRGPPAAAVHGQPAPEDAGGRRLGHLAARRRRAATTAPCSPPQATNGKLWSLLREQVAGTSAVDQDARRREVGDDPAADRLAAVLRVGRRPVGQDPRGAVRPRVAPPCAGRTARRALDRRRPRLRHRSGGGGARAVRRRRHRGRSLRRDAAGGAHAAARLAECRGPPRRARGAARSTTARSTPRR